MCSVASFCWWACCHCCFFQWNPYIIMIKGRFGNAYIVKKKSNSIGKMAIHLFEMYKLNIFSITYFNVYFKSFNNIAPDFFVFFNVRFCCKITNVVIFLFVWPSSFSPSFLEFYYFLNSFKNHAFCLDSYSLFSIRLFFFIYLCFYRLYCNRQDRCFPT